MPIKAQGTVTSVTNIPMPTCLISSHVLLEVLNHAQLERIANGKADAYIHLLARFHQAILPPFLFACQGNLSEASRLLGIHRETVRAYIKGVAHE